MSSVRTLCIVLTITLIASTSCGGDSTGPSTLSDAEFTALLNAFARVGANSATFSQPVSALGGTRATGRVIAAATTTTITTDTTYACSGGGSSRAQGTTSLTSTDGTNFTATGTVTLGFTGCKEAASTGELFTFDGSPNLVEALTAVSTSANSVFTMHVTGGLRWTLNGKSGTCTFNVTDTDTETSTSSTDVVTGTICGRSAPQSFGG